MVFSTFHLALVVPDSYRGLKDKNDNYHLVNGNDTLLSVFTYKAEEAVVQHTFICSSHGNEQDFCSRTACFLFVAQYKAWTNEMFVILYLVTLVSAEQEGIETSWIE